MRILLIDNNIETKGAHDLRRDLTRRADVTLETRRGPEMDFPEKLESYDGLVVSGSKTSVLDDSAWVGALENLFCRFLDASKPILGVCFGHQVLARTLGGKHSVEVSATPEHGWTQIRVHHGSRLFEGLPHSFYSFSSHFDQVASTPPHSHIIASSDRCAVQGFEIVGKPIFGIQFHPEKNLEECRLNLMEWKKEKKTKRHILLPQESNRLYDPKVSEKIFSNFLETCR